MGDRFLVAVDFSRLTIPTISYAVKLAAGPPHRIDLVHVVGGAGGAAVVQVAAKDLLDSLERREQDGARRRLQNLMDELVPEAIHGDVIVATGSPAHVIEHLTNTPDRYEMVVISTNGRTGLQKMLLGSVAEQVLHNVALPVLVVRTP